MTKFAIVPCWLGWFSAAALLSFPVSIVAQALPYLFESEGTGPPNKLYWQTEPGVRYDLWTSDNLSSWQRVSGYPAVADGLAMEHAITPSPSGKGFFKMIPIDEQAPVVVAQYPAVDGFAVGRFADLTIELSDATGIDPASIRFTVGGIGPLAPGAPGLVVAGNTVTYDSGDSALGIWGATVTATLVAADTLGHTLTHTWSFKLEPQPQTASNLFVFGSPTAQRAGQSVSGPTASLAARFPAPTGPVKASDPKPWSIHEVLPDRVVIAYAAGSAPIFTVGQLICNLAPTKESEIFYRRVISTSNDVANFKLTMITSDAELTDFASSGSAAVSENSVVYELNEAGTLVKAVAVTGSRTFPRIGYDLSGSRFKFRNDGYEVTVKGLTYSSGSQLPWLDVTATDYSWWFTPRVQAGLELGLTGLKSFEVIASGQVSSSTALDAEVILIGVSVKRTLYDLPEAKEPRHVVYLGNIGPVPVFATLGFDFSITSKAEAKALLDFNLTYRQEASASFGIVYERGEPLDWIHSFQATSPDFRGAAALTGEFSYELKLEPRLEFMVYGLAGVKAAIEPSAGVVATASTGGGFGGKLEASMDFVLGTAGPAFDPLGINKELSLNLWEGEWPLTPQALAFKTHPTPRTVAPGANVSFTCTLEGPSNPAFQWYHNGRMIPGQISRSLFLSNVNNGHAGTYHVSAKAGNLLASSNSAILTVHAVTSENLDIDGDAIPNLTETNTGIWVSSTNRGTNPNHWDSDGDGLSDGVETNTRVYVSRSNTGTNPNQADTDGDGINDKQEIDVGTEPNVAPIPPAPEGFVLIPAGTFNMGRSGADVDSGAPQVAVTVSAFYIGKYEVTKALWDEVRTWGAANGYTDLNVGGGKASNHPVQSISWFDMVKWCNARSQKDGLIPVYTVDGELMKTGTMEPVANWGANGYRLPTEAEWEKAARGGLNDKRFPWGTDTISHSQANYFGGGWEIEIDLSNVYDHHPEYKIGAEPYTSPVGSFPANAYGLHDMAGNVWEWCWDWYDLYVDGVTDPRGPTSSIHGLNRVMRGGSWGFDYYWCSTWQRGLLSLGLYSTTTDLTLGFRTARSLVP